MNIRSKNIANVIKAEAIKRTPYIACITWHLWERVTSFFFKYPDFKNPVRKQEHVAIELTNEHYAYQRIILVMFNYLVEMR